MRLLIIGLVIALVGCSKPSGVEVVRQGYLADFPQTSVGSAFNHWRECKSVMWSDDVLPNGVGIVKYHCESASAGELVAAVKAAMPDIQDADYLQIEAVTHQVMWIVHPDGEFHMDEYKVQWCWRNSVCADPALQHTQSWEKLESVYRNEVVFDVSKILLGDSTQQFVIATGIQDIWLRLYDLYAE